MLCKNWEKKEAYLFIKQIRNTTINLVPKIRSIPVEVRNVPRYQSATKDYTPLASYWKSSTM